jgi:hypothetical protein
VDVFGRIHQQAGDPCHSQHAGGSFSGSCRLVGHTTVFSPHQLSFHVSITLWATGPGHLTGITCRHDPSHELATMLCLAIGPGHRIGNHPPGRPIFGTGEFTPANHCSAHRASHRGMQFSFWTSKPCCDPGTAHGARNPLATEVCSCVCAVRNILMKKGVTS